MKKVIIRGSITVALFLSILFFLAQMDWVKMLKIDEATNQTEEKLGELFLEAFQKSDKEITDSFVVNSVDSIVSRICTSNSINREFIKVHIFEKDDINAFALPNGHLIIFSGLIINTDNEEELSGVICHEIAHIQLNHVMKKLVKEIGLSVLISMTTGNGGGEIIKQTTKMLSSSAFDRNLEMEADIKAVDYLVIAKINPEPFADFLYKLSADENEVTKYFTWISTHPESKERAEYIVEYGMDKKVIFEKILTKATWNNLKVVLNQ